MKNALLLILLFLSVLAAKTQAQQSRLCLDNICVGDDVDQLDIHWKKIKIDYKTKRAVDSLIQQSSVKDIYYDYNETLVTTPAMLKDLVPYVIQLQKFDQNVLDKLGKVKAICSPLSLTGEVNDTNLNEKLFVTFRVVADDGGRGRLRVVQLEKEYKIYPPHIRPSDKKKYKNTLEQLKVTFPKIVEVRDIDARAETNEIAFASALLGYRFFSDSRNPLIFRIRDTADFESIEFDENRSKLCPIIE